MGRSGPIRPGGDADLSRCPAMVTCNLHGHVACRKYAGLSRPAVGGVYGDIRLDECRRIPTYARPSLFPYPCANAAAEGMLGHMADDIALRRTNRYRNAFSDYLRRGTPVALSLKREDRTGRYVWRTRGDSRVRPEHAANNGRVFYWSDPPPTGHPGEAYGCRCRAEPCEEGQTEFAEHRITTPLRDSGRRWEAIDFVRHFYFGGGRPAHLGDMGHFRDIVENRSRHRAGKI